MTFLDKLLAAPNTNWIGHVYPWGSILMRDRSNVQPNFECWSSEAAKFGLDYEAEVDPVFNKFLVMRLKANPEFGDLIARSGLRLANSVVARVTKTGELKICAIPMPVTVTSDLGFKAEWLNQGSMTGVRVSKSLVDAQIILVKLKSDNREISHKIFRLCGRKIYRGRNASTPQSISPQLELIEEVAES